MFQLHHHSTVVRRATLSCCSVRPRPSSFVFVRRSHDACCSPAGAEASEIELPSGATATRRISSIEFRRHRPRWIHCSAFSTVQLLHHGEQRRSQHSQPSSAPRPRSTFISQKGVAVAINKRLVELGKQQEWEDLLLFAEQERENLNNVNYATLMSQLGRIRSFDRADPRFLALLQALAAMMEERGLPWVEARSATNIIHAIGKMNLRNQSTRRILEWISDPETAASFVKEGEPQALSNVAWACAALNHREALNLLVEIDRRSEWLVDNGTPQAVSNVAWAFATLGFQAPHLFAGIEKRSKWLVKEGTPQVVANMAWACGRLGCEAPNLFAEIERRSKRLVGVGKPQEVSNTAWACASLGFQAPNLFAEIELQSRRLVEQGTPQTVANTAWACAKAGFKAANMFTEIERQSDWFVKEGKTQEVANTAWSCATLGFVAPNLFNEIEGRSKWLFEEGKPQEVANTAWACGRLGCEAPRLFAEIEREANRFVEAGNPQEVSNTAWACGKLGFEAPNLFAEIERQSKWLVEEGRPEVAASVAWACAKLKYDVPNLFAEIDRQSKRILEKAGPQEVANTVWACAILGYKSPTLFAELAQHLDRFVDQGNPQEISNTCYAFSVLGLSRESETSLVKLWDRAIDLFLAEEDKFCDEELVQLLQTRMFAKADGVLLKQPPETMAKRMELALKAQSVKNITSPCSNEVSLLLRELGFQHEVEVSPDVTASGMLEIDFACPERKIAIEYNGHTHYLKAVGNGQLTSTENGATKAKRRYLEKLGWTVINMDYRDYVQAQGASNEKGWLQEKLVKAGISLSE